MDEKVLIYKGIVIRRFDMYLLEHGTCVTDRIIELYFSYLASRYDTDDILFIPPSVSSFLAQPSDTISLKESIKPLKLDQRKLILFPVRDPKSTAHPKLGPHWSLLVYARTIHMFMHHDCFDGFNLSQAKMLYENVKSFVGDGGMEPLRKPRGKNKRPKCDPWFIDTFAPVQADEYDSGPFVFVTADTVCKWLNSWARIRGECWLSDLKKRYREESSVNSKKRAEVLDLIDSLDDDIEEDS